MRDSERDQIGYLPLPQTAYNVEAILDRLSADGYTGYITLEPHVPADDVIRFYDIELPYVRRWI